jgi:hypothetical protein
MKKLSYIVLFLIFAMNLTAQSVWDGKREAIINGSGTENDPYLIENAQQFAWLIYVINWDYSRWTEGKYFLLTTDIDLNGSVDNQWIPIGAGPSADFHKYFDGVFDGGFHKITGLYIDDENPINDNNSMWVSSYAGFFTELKSDAVIKNLYLEGFVSSGRKSGGFSGSSNGVFEYCIANVDVASTSGSSAGIASFGNPTVRFCANLGDIKGKNGVGGIIGMNGHVESCYNMGKIAGEDVVGGIAGRSNDIKNSYNVGEVSYLESTNNKGAIVGNKPSGGSIENCHYLEGCIAESNSFGEPQTAVFMRSEEFVNMLNSDTDVWVFDEGNINDGYPVFGNTQFGIEEILTEFPDMVMVYPNPVVDNVYVVGDVTSCEIYDLVGKCVKSVSTNMEEIRVTDLQSGIYMMRFLTNNGSVVTKKIIKK